LEGRHKVRICHGKRRILSVKIKKGKIFSDLPLP
jgi:hypothetical protein